MDMVRMPKADWTDICDAVREKTETNDMLLSGAVAGMVRGISGGGGSIESGTFVLDEGSATVIIPITKKCSKVVIWHEPLELPPTGFSKYDNFHFFAADGLFMISGHINSLGTGYAGGVVWEKDYQSYNYTYFNDSNIEICCKTSGYSGQKFAAGAEYKWEAW